MNEWLSSLVDSTVQCWGCPVFDNLFQLVSNAAAAAYDKFALVCVVLFCVIFAFFVFSAVWKNFTNGLKDSFYQKSVIHILPGNSSSNVFFLLFFTDNKFT